LALEKKIYYIDRAKIDLRLPYLRDEGEEIIVSARDVLRCIAMAPIEDVLPINIVVNKMLEKLYPLYKDLEISKAAWRSIVNKIVDEVLKELH
jgi:hypothetical protein